MAIMLNDENYLQTVNQIKQEIAATRYKAVVQLNQTMMTLYYHIGQIINEHKAWGSKFVDNLATDIRTAYPDSRGFSPRNLRYMAKFAELYPTKAILQQPVAKLPWGQNVLLMNSGLSTDVYLWYAEKALENGWSRNVLAHQIDSKLYERQVLAKKINNFEQRLPVPQSEMAKETLKDPYMFDFIAMREDMVEKDIEDAMVDNVTELLLELGKGFAFIGRQYHLEVGGEDFYLDLLFYNLNLRCYVVIELKTGDFKPEYAGKLNFYLSAVDDILKKEQDNP